MKKLIALLLALILCFALAACGGQPAPVEPEEPDAPAEEPVDEDPPAEAAGDWNDFADVLTKTYCGLTEAGETVVFVMTEDETFAALAVVNTDTMESISFVGAMEPVEFEDGTVGFMISDETNGLTFSFSCEFYDDDSVALDLGDYGAMAIMPCEQSEAFDMLNAIDAQTVAVA